MYIFLYQAVIPPDQMLPLGTSAYHFFASQGMIRELMVCIKQGIDLNTKTPSSMEERPAASALHLAAKNARTQVCALLLETQ